MSRSSGSKEPVGFGTHITAGGIAGAMEALCCQPLDTIKVRMQLSRSGRAAGTKPRGFLATGAMIVKRETPLALYKGLGAVLSGIVPKMATRFASFEAYKEWLADEKTGKTSVGNIFVAGLGAGTTEAVVVVTPMEVVKIRLQAQMHSLADPLETPRYRNAGHAVYTIVREEGISALYRGVTLTAVRQATNQGANFTAYQEIKKLAHRLQPELDGSELPSYQHMGIGLISGAMGPFSNAPIDTIKTRLQKSTFPPSTSALSRISSIATEMWRVEGVSSFYKGITPRVLRVAPGQAIVFAVYEREAKKALDEAKAKAMALAGKTALPVPASVPAKPSAHLNRAAFGGLGLKGLPLKPDLLKKAASLDDAVETKRKLETLGDMPAIDMSMAEGENTIGDLEVDDDDEEANRMDAALKAKPAEAMEVDDDDVDPLDAFMSGVKDEVKKVNADDMKKLVGANGRMRERMDDSMNDGGAAADDTGDGAGDDELDTTELNPEDILALAAKKAKKKELAAVDHSRMSYEPFRKEFYMPPPDIAAMTDEEADLLRLELDSIKIRGVDCPRPVTKWSHFGLPTSVLDVIKRLNYAAPTSIQAQAVPAIMSGRDVIGVAKTGSGKTVAFLLPVFRHIKDQRPLEQMEGPIAIIMTPTRELAVQIHRDCKPFLKVLNLRAVCAYGGSPIKDQIADMKKGAEIIVCTPGRMIDLLTANSGRVTNLKRVTYLVLDEADRMFDMGFEPQVMKIVNNIRPDRQTLLFSATFPKQMDSLARKILRKPLEITVGGRSVVAAEIDQIVEVRPEETKFNRLLEVLGQMYNEDPEARTLIFVDRQEAADNLLRELMRKGYLCMSLHGGKDQVDRDSTIADFKAGVVPIVIATSVAARGLDVKQLKLVINFDAPNHMEDYVHRAGRTGRAGNKGTCITFITPEQDRYSVDIYRALKASNANVPQELEELANGFLDKVKAGKAHAAGSGFGGKGLDRLDKERDAREKAERKAYGEPDEEKAAAEGEAAAGGTTTAAKKEPADDMTFGNFKVEIKRGPAPDSSKGQLGVAGAAAAARRLAHAKEEEKIQSSLRAAEEAAARAGKDSPAHKQALSVVAKLNAQMRASKLALQAQIQAEDVGRKVNPDSTDFHAIVPINDYPQKARWRVTNKETMVQLIDMTGASVTNKGIFYEPSKEPPPEGPPKLHLLIESNEEWRVEHAVREIKRLLIEASAAALQAEMRNPTATSGRYSVV